MGTEILGFIGALLIVVAYVPQIKHIVSEHCAGGISMKSWIVWFVATVLILIHALTTTDLVFKLLQVINLIAILVVVGLINVYGDRVCHSKEARPEVRK